MTISWIKNKIEKQEYDLSPHARLASSYHDTELQFSGYGTPKVLFRGARGKGAVASLTTNSLNPRNALLWFTPNENIPAIFGTSLNEESNEANGELKTGVNSRCWRH